jgi:predicted negative regulator of RcsB-dependent stress response|tara:strand:+ start:1271 stop:1894 length:624 start_codon:yes stop_codon:yes gene_type:complete
VSDYLSDEEQVDRIKQWWSENGMTIVVSLFGAIIGVVGWNWYESRSEERSAAAFNVYAEYLEQRKLSGSQDSALKNLDEEYEGSAYHTFTLFFRAKDAVDSDDFEGALRYLNLAVDTTNDGSLKDIALLRLSKIQMQMEAFESALQSLSMMRGGGYKAVVAELTGDIYYSQGKIELAKEAYQAGLDGLSDSDAAGLLRLKHSSLVVE